MPAPPELGHALGDIGVIEVDAELEAQHPAQAAGHVGVTGEVEVNLQGVGAGPRPGPQHPGGHGVGGHGVPEHAELVGQQDLLRHADHEQAHAGVEQGGRLVAGDELVVHVLVADDGTGDELGEEGDVAGEVHQAVGGLAVVPIHVDEVGHGLEGVEGDADGQGDAHVRQAGEGRDLLERPDEQARILKHTQGRQVNDDAEDQNDTLAGPGGLLFDEDAAEVVDQDGPDHDQNIDRLTVGVEDQVGQQKEEVPELKG